MVTKGPILSFRPLKQPLPRLQKTLKCTFFNLVDAGFSSVNKITEADLSLAAHRRFSAGLPLVLLPIPISLPSAKIKFNKRENAREHRLS